MKKIILLLCLALMSPNIYTQKKGIIDDFGNPLTKIEFRKIKKTGGNIVRLRKNTEYKKGIIPDEYKGEISDSLKSVIVNYLQAVGNLQIKSNDIIVINYAIDQRCNIINNINFIPYLEAIQQKPDVVLCLMTSNYNKRIKNQIVDEKRIITDNFFKYTYWELPGDLKCGGELVIYPDNTFFRIFGEYNPMELIDKL